MSQTAKEFSLIPQNEKLKNLFEKYISNEQLAEILKKDEYPTTCIVTMDIKELLALNSKELGIKMETNITTTLEAESNKLKIEGHSKITVTYKDNIITYLALAKQCDEIECEAIVMLLLSETSFNCVFLSHLIENNNIPAYVYTAN